jgi:beta-galactosidase
MRTSHTLVLAAALFTSACAAPPPPRQFTIGEADFLLDGQPLQIRSGEMHAARVPPEYWRHRLRLIKAMGCNTVCAYLFWNQHEPRPGEFDFAGSADVARYCRLAAEEGLYVILRPGPYSCAEWEFGGFPWWLLRDGDMKVRTQDERYLAAVRRYLLRIGEELAPLQVTRGGPILMVQVENEYGSYGSDKQYIGRLRDLLVEAGFEVPLFTCDGPSQLPNDTRDDLFCVVNFGGDPAGGFAALRKVRPAGPLMCGEYYPGWFDSWGKPHHRGNTDGIVADLGWMLEHNASFSIYMVHGGTSFGFTAGANSPPFAPQSTSYDYDAPIDESGHATAKYYAIRKLFAQHLQPGETLPDVPRPAMELVALPAATFQAVAVLRDQELPWIEADTPWTFERLGQAAGFVRYRMAVPGPGTLQIDTHDHAQVSFRGERLAILDRRHRQREVVLPHGAHGELEVLVEAFGRVNYGPDIHDHKGLVAPVTIDGSPIVGVQMQQWPLDAAFLRELRYTPCDGQRRGPAVYRGTLRVEQVGDTFLDLSSWQKGSVWVNGHHLGRYWDLGPQQTLYLPGCWLHEGDNEILVLDATGGARELLVAGRDRPILDRVGNDPFAPVRHRRADQRIELRQLKPVHRGVLAPGKARQTAMFAPTTGRHVCLEALTSLANDPFTTLAEVDLLDADGKPLPRDSWRVVYADSEELGGDDGNAANAIDGARDTFWHTQWQGASPAHPHQLVLDLGAEVTIHGIRLLPRQDSANGRIGEYRVFIASSPFAGT